MAAGSTDNSSRSDSEQGGHLGRVASRALPGGGPDGHPDPPLLVSVPAPLAATHRACPLILRVERAEDLGFVSGVPPERVAWVETPFALADRPELRDLPLDVVLEAPRREAAGLYSLLHLHDGCPVRVTIPALPGLGRAGAIAVALHLRVRILPGQPAEEAILEMEDLLERYLHDPSATEPVEFFHSALATLIHGDPATLWEVLEQDPDLFPRVDREGGIVEGGGLSRGPMAPAFVLRHRAALVASAAECAACPCLDWCAGYFKWPDPSFACTSVRRLLDRIKQAADQLQRDLLEAEALAL